MLDLALWQTRFAQFLELRRYSPRTRDNYVGELKALFAFLAEAHVCSLSDVTPEVVEAYRLHLFYAEHHGKKLTLATQSYRLSSVKCFLRFLTRARYVLVDPAVDVDLPRPARPLPGALLSEAEVAALLVACDTSGPLGVRNRAILEVVYGTAIRNSELRELVLDDVDLGRRELRIRYGKGGKSRVVPLGEEAAFWLERWLTHGRPQLVAADSGAGVFLTDGGRKLSRSALCEVVRGLGAEAGLTKRVSAHLLRHACATHMLARGAGLRHLQELLGHASPATTQRYTRVEMSDLRRVLARFHPREQGGDAS